MTSYTGDAGLMVEFQNICPLDTPTECCCKYNCEGGCADYYGEPLGYVQSAVYSLSSLLMYFMPGETGLGPPGTTYGNRKSLDQLSPTLPVVDI